MGAQIAPEVRDNYEALVAAGRFAGWQGLRDYAAQEEDAAGRSRTMGAHESGGWLQVIALCDEHLAADVGEKPVRGKGRGTERAVDGGAESREEA